MRKGVVKKVLFYAAVGVVAVMGIALALVYTYQDKIIELFVTEANKHIKTKVEVEQISLSLFDKFPHVAVSLDQVNVHEGLPESKESLARADKLYFTFSLLDVIRGKYTVKQFYMEKGEVYVKVLPDGSVNYQVWNADTTSAGDEDFSFDLEKINLNEVAVHYIDQQMKHTYEVDAHALEAAMALSSETIDIEASGNTTIHTVKVGTGEYFKGKKVDVATALTVDRAASVILLQPSAVLIEGAAYEVGGTVGYGGTTTVDLKLDGKNTNVQSLLSLLPQDITQEFRQYRSEGDIYFNGSVKGNVSAKETPLISFNFGARNASFYHPDVKQRVEKINLTGSFTNGEKQKAATSALELKSLSGVLNGRPFKGNLTYRNFDNPSIAFDVQGMLDVGYVLGLAKMEQVRSGSGLADVRIAFSGNLNEFKARPGNSTLNTTGDITLHNVSLNMQDLPMPVTNLSGNLMFKRNDVAVSDFKGKLGDSDFVVNGMFKNMMAWLLLERQRLLVEADFKSSYLNFNQLLSEELNTAEADRTGSSDSYKFAISPNIAFDLSASIDRLRFRRFRGKNVQGEVKLRNQVLSTPNISFRAIGGDFAVRGTLDARTRDHIKVSTATKLNNMSVDSLFYVFENFHQNFIEERHLRGQLTANIVSDVFFDSQLNPKTNLLQAEIDATVRNGQLVNFAPMQKMSAFVKRSELANMRFAELHNSFWIQQRTIYIPEMDIRSNVSAAPVVSISGTHTFDQLMDYKIKLPVLSSRRPDKDAVFGVVAEDSDAGNSSLFLTLKGNEKDFRIAYDNERVRQKVKADLKEEGQELKDLLRGKKPKTKEEKKVELQEGEYFDFN
ncbi:AsmA-like C-terminal region-containing protein [Pontibacter toksunensis]|uniref:AsmA-like C-terminal region-containing protein n=1 Tax=Pontibacter toksunensis TaxID=1332631 RepID=UPI00366B06D3